MKFSFFDVMRKFEIIKRSNEFVEYQKEFARMLTSTLCKEYPKEVPSVQAINDFVTSYQHFTKNNLQAGTIRFDLVANSFFVHGNSAQVQFDYPGKIKEPVELGDIIFICTLVVQGKRYFERLTISQFKVDNDTKKVFSWTIDNDKQLYLLSHFPKFKCVKGILPHIEYTLPNISGCLGSYGLIQKSGDLVFISATLLDALLGKTQTIKKSELYGKSTSPHIKFPLGGLINDCHLCLEAYNFADNYLGLNIGEPLVFRSLNYNLQARAILGDLANSLKGTHNQVSPNKGVLAFLDSFKKFPYVDGFGQDELQENLVPINSDNRATVIHTIIRMAE